MDVPIFDIKDGRKSVAVLVAKLHTMSSLDRGFFHLIGDRMAAVSGEAIDAGPDEEMGSQLVRDREELVDIAFAVANVDAPARILK